MMETPDGFVPQEQHDAAMFALRVEFSEAANARQAEINDLQKRLEVAAESAKAEVNLLSAERDAIRLERDQWKEKATEANTDNAALRDSLASYLLKTDGGQAAMREFRKMILTSNIQAAQAELISLQG